MSFELKLLRDTVYFTDPNIGKFIASVSTFDLIFKKNARNNFSRIHNIYNYSTLDHIGKGYPDGGVAFSFFL